MNFKQIPNYILDIANKLHKNGFEAHLVGGSVRDLLLGKSPKDYDITTNALPEQLMEIFPESVLTGAKFGTVKVVAIRDDGERDIVDVTTYRSEEDYIGGRWPSKVEFSKTIDKDLSRRDFTINAMAINLESPELQIIDLFGGQKDLENKIIRAVGNPIERFNEDGLRPFRACRIASTLGFTIEENTFKAIQECLDIAKLVSTERINIEFTRLIKESPIPSIGLELMREAGLLEIFLPELLEGYGMDQNEYHKFDVYHHLLHTMDIAPKDIRLAALFHDIAKPRKKSGEHFYGHDIEGEKMVREIMTRLKFPIYEIERIAKLVRWHMFYYPENKNDFKQRNEKELNPEINNDHIEKERKEARNSKMAEGWSDNAIRRFISKVGGDEAIDDLIELRIADAKSTNPDNKFDPTEIQRLESRIGEVRLQENILKITDLAINGNDLMEIGIPQGQKIKEILEDLLEEVIDDQSKNNKEYLIQRATELRS